MLNRHVFYMHNSLFGKGRCAVFIFYIYFNDVYSRLFCTFCFVQILPCAKHHIFKLLFCNCRSQTPEPERKFSLCYCIAFNKKKFALMFRDYVGLDVSEMDVSSRHRIAFFFKIFCGDIFACRAEFSVIFHFFALPTKERKLFLCSGHGPSFITASICAFVG